MKAKAVIKAVMVVEFWERLGIFNNELLIRIKENLEKTAKIMDKINFQLNIKCKKFLKLNKSPDIKFLSPRSTVAAAVEIEKKIVQNKTVPISIIFLCSL